MSKGLEVIRSQGSIRVKVKAKVIVGSPGGGEVVVVEIGLRIVRGGGLVRIESDGGGHVVLLRIIKRNEAFLEATIRRGVAWSGCCS